MTDLRPITDAEAHPWPRPCQVCGLLLGAAAYQAHRTGHLIEGFRGLGTSTRAANHAMLALGDAMVRNEALLRDGEVET